MLAIHIETPSIIFSIVQLGLNEAEETGMESSILEEKPSMANYQSFAMDVSMTSLPSSPCLSPNSLAAAKEQDTKFVPYFYYFLCILLLVRKIFEFIFSNVNVFQLSAHFLSGIIFT